MAADASQSSTFIPGFTLFSGWDTSPTSSKHGSWNVALPAVPVNPRGSAGLTFVGQASTTVEGGVVSYTFYNLPAGHYSLWVGGNGTVASPVGSQSYVATITASPITPSVREDNDGDKHADILWYNSGASVLWGAGYGDAYELLSDVGLPVPTAPITVSGGFAGVPIPSAFTIQGRGNFILDNNSDILWGNASNQLYISQRVAASPAAYSIRGPLACAPTTSAVAGTGDYNGDQISDILLKDSVTGNVSVLLMSGFGTTILNNPSAVGATPACSSTFATPPTATSVVKGTGDYNGDGKADILWGNSAGQVDVQYTGVVGTTTLSALSGLVVEGSGNFDGDAAHTSDVLLRSATGDVSIKTDVLAAPSTAGTAISAPGLLAGSNVPNVWKVKGTADYDGDGKNDILWRNYDPAATSFNNYVMLMNGPAVRVADSNILPSYEFVPITSGWDLNYTQSQ